LLSIIFGILMLLVQRSEKKRRVVTLGVMLFVWPIVWGYGIFRISNDCTEVFRAVCAVTQGKMTSIAWNTTNMAALTAFTINFLFWFLIGRYNPPRSSDAIKVIGMND
jgi:hypothetical protein